MPASLQDLTSISQSLEREKVPASLKEDILSKGARALRASFLESERFLEYVGWVVSLPWEKATEDVLDLTAAKNVLDSAHHGLSQIKERILEYIAVMKLARKKDVLGELRAPILCFVGLVGTGKTTIAASIARALGRKFVRIAFGGLGDPGMLRGEASYRVGEPGQVIKALRRAQAKNPVILLDEIDRIVEDARASIMGVLVEMLDPDQNHAFVDSYIDYPFDLSQVLFVVTANNTTNIATAVLDRLEVIQMPSYTDEEKVVIGRDFLLPKILAEAGIEANQVRIEDSVWSLIVRPLGFDAGMRTLERTIQAVVRKLARLVVEGKATAFQLNETNIKEYLPTW